MVKIPTAIARIAAGLLLANSAHAAFLGDAANYNVFIFGSGDFVSQNTDTMGDLAAGGDVSLMNYGVAQGIAGDPTQTPNPARLVVGGKLTATNGGVGSNQRGTLYTNTAASLTGFTVANTLPQTVIGSFSADQTQYTNLSSSLGTLASNGSSVLGSGNTLTLTGTASGLNVFDISAATLSSADTVNISAPLGSTVLINVSGTSATLQNGNVNETGGIGAGSVLYNFYQALTVNLPGSKDPEGSILAPLAGVMGPGMNGGGQMHGQLIAGSYSGDTQFDSVPFTGSLPTVPLPAAAWLFASGLAGLLPLRRRRAAA